MKNPWGTRDCSSGACKIICQQSDMPFWYASGSNLRQSNPIGSCWLPLRVRRIDTEESAAADCRLQSELQAILPEKDPSQVDLTHGAAQVGIGKPLGAVGPFAGAEKAA